MNIDAVIADIVRFRRELHRIPEIAGKEFKTCAAIRRELAEIPGVRVLPPFLETDTVAFIDGKAPGKNVTLRADIDALRLDEATGLDFASEVPGMMHACGHDLHTAVLLGAARILAARRDEFCGSVRLVFQPGEENAALAKPLIEAGALDDPPADFVAGLHCEPGMKSGAIGVRAGAMMSSCSHFHVKFFGKGGHGSRPHCSLNPVIAACAAVMELQNLTALRVNSQNPAVVSVCSFHGGRLDNVIPEDAEFIGTLRALDNDTAQLLRSELVRICEAVAVLHKMSCKVEFAPNGYPATVNSESGAAAARAVIGSIGAECIEMPESAMSSEDFSYFLLKAADGVFVKLGIGETCAPLHNCSFNPEESAIPVGIAFMSEIALAALK